MKKLDNYQTALDYIFSFVDNSRTHQQNLSPENFDLSRVERLCELIGNPQDQYLTVHVAGSKGKGSVCAMVASVLMEAGYRVGLYTSPHLEEFVERIQINGVPVSDSTVVEAMDHLQRFIEQIEDITTFEIMTILGFLVFAQKEVDIAVIEVGLGGRLDATNVITPLVSVITSLSLEHTYVLGNTIEEIAGEKGGIIKDGIPVVSAPQEDTARRVLQEIAADEKAQIYFVDEILKKSSAMIDGWKQEFQVEGQIGGVVVHDTIRIPLLGEHQRINAMTAYAALKLMEQAEIQLSERAIADGFSKVEWPGRFEVLDESLPFIIDAAHNEDSMRQLSNTLEQIFPSRQVILIFGVSADKNVSGMINALADKISHVICVASHHPRAMDAQDLAGYFLELQIPTDIVEGIEAAIAKGKSLVTKDQILVGAGSLFVVGEIRGIWNNSAKTGL